MIDIAKLTNEIKSIHIEKEEIIKKEKELTKPVLTDFDDIGLIYKIYTDSISRRTVLSAHEYEYKLIFSAIVCLLYAPRVLADNRIPRNLRKCIGEVSDTDKSFISRNISNVVFRYQTMRGFKDEFDYLYTEIMRGLIESGRVLGGGFTALPET